MLLAVGHLVPIQALFPAAQAAFAITFGIGFANAEIRLIHCVAVDVKKGRLKYNTYFQTA